MIQTSFFPQPEKDRKQGRGRYWADPEKANLRTNTWKKNNKEKVRETEISYRSKEHGHFKELWAGVKKSKHGHNFKNYDDFFQCWLDQKAIH